MKLQDYNDIFALLPAQSAVSLILSTQTFTYLPPPPPPPSPWVRPISSHPVPQYKWCWPWEEALRDSVSKQPLQPRWMARQPAPTWAPYCFKRLRCIWFILPCMWSSYIGGSSIAWQVESNAPPVGDAVWHVAKHWLHGCTSDGYIQYSLHFECTFFFQDVSSNSI